MSEEWISAREALALAKDKMSLAAARLGICSRAFDQVIQARAKRWVTDGGSIENSHIPYVFWWAKGYEALQQNWVSGDFETVFREKRLRAYGVQFNRQQIFEFYGIEPTKAAETPATANAEPERSKETDVAGPLTNREPIGSGGRAPGLFWEDLLVEIARQIYDNELKPSQQADVEAAMHD